MAACSLDSTGPERSHRRSSCATAAICRRTARGASWPSPNRPARFRAIRPAKPRSRPVMQGAGDAARRLAPAPRRSSTARASKSAPDQGLIKEKTPRRARRFFRKRSAAAAAGGAGHWRRYEREGRIDPFAACERILRRGAVRRGPHLADRAGHLRARRSRLVLQRRLRCRARQLRRPRRRVHGGAVLPAVRLRVVSHPGDLRGHRLALFLVPRHGRGLHEDHRRAPDVRLRQLAAEPGHRERGHRG